VLLLHAPLNTTHSPYFNSNYTHLAKPVYTATHVRFAKVSNEAIMRSNPKQVSETTKQQHRCIKASSKSFMVVYSPYQTDWSTVRCW